MRFGAISANRWWRASDYEVVGGTHLAPRQGAELEVYRPLDHFRAGAGKGPTPRPYVELLRIERFDVEALAEWCSRHGLLGILTHRTVEAYLWPRWTEGTVPTGGAVGTLGGGSVSKALVPEQLQYRQGLGARTVQSPMLHRPTWDRRLDGEEDGQGVKAEDPVSPADLDTLLSQGDQGWSDFRPPSVRIVDPAEGAEKSLGVAAGWAQFFPRCSDVARWTSRHAEAQHSFFTEGTSEALESENVDELGVELSRRSYPLPFSAVFLEEYGEPLHLMWRLQWHVEQVHSFWARAMEVHDRDELESLLAEFRGKPELDRPPVVDSCLRGLSIRAGFAGVEGRWEQAWSIPSLYGALGAMMLHDYPWGNRTPRSCEECGRLFTTDIYNQKFCRKTCRGTFNQRKWREGKQDEKQKMLRRLKGGTNGESDNED